MKIEQMFGVSHGAHHQLTQEEVRTAPDKLTYRSLLNLPTGTNVGVEFTPELAEPITINDETVFANDSSIFYWSRILRICNLAKLDVIMLEDFPTYYAHVVKDRQYHQLEQEYEQRKANGNDISERERIDYRKKGHRLAVERDYLFYVIREDKIVEKIKETKPKVVVLGGAHSDYIDQNSDALGIEVEEYLWETSWTERMNAYSSFSEDAYEGVMELMREHGKRNFLGPKLHRDYRLLLPRELAERKYTALTQGRIIPEDTPAYIGTWDPEVPENGLFEVYPMGTRKDGTIFGLIEDTIGTANFSGRFTDGQINFVKAYVAKESDMDLATKDRVFFIAENTGFANEYLGTFETSSYKRTFTIKPFLPSLREVK